MMSFQKLVKPLLEVNSLVEFLGLAVREGPIFREQRPRFFPFLRMHNEREGRYGVVQKRGTIPCRPAPALTLV